MGEGWVGKIFSLPSPIHSHSQVWRTISISKRYTLGWKTQKRTTTKNNKSFINTITVHLNFLLSSSGQLFDRWKKKHTFSGKMPSRAEIFLLSFRFLHSCDISTSVNTSTDEVYMNEQHTEKNVKYRLFIYYIS
jgi:hypothetical protein